ncbi:MAG: MATE family efflux transporter [Gammaproteobacteria bacterium]|nr:MATE family efflux transporter [Gammaproteobacteria bacterium]
MVSGLTENLRTDLLQLFRVGWPLILNNVFSIGVNVADTLMVGRLGATQLAALSIGSSIWISVFLAGLGILMALGPTVSHHYGANRLRQIGYDTQQAAWLAMVIALIVIGVLHCASPLLRWLGIDREVSALAVQYLHVLSFGVPGLYFYHVLRQMNEGIGRTVPIMVVTGVALVLNVLFSFCFVFGALSAPRLGVVGSAVGSSLGFWCMFVMIAGYVGFHPFYARFGFQRKSAAPDLVALRRLLGLGGPIGLSLLMQAGLFTALALLMGMLGSNYAAGHQIALNYAGLVFMLPLGLAFATAVLVGQALGRGEPTVARRVGFVGISTCLVIASGIAVLTFCNAHTIARWYTQDLLVIAIATSLLAVSAVLQMGDGTQSAAAGALRGLKDTRVPMLLNGLIYWGVGFVAAYLLGITFGFGARGIWCGLALALCVAAVTLTLRFRYVIGQLCPESRIGA